jgi:uncharacterized protein with PIN domain
VSGTYTRAQRAALEQALKERRELRCPECDVPLTQQPVTPAPGVPYVRHRVWLLCSKCRRTASLDR